MVYGTHFLSQGKNWGKKWVLKIDIFDEKVVFWDTFWRFGPLLKHGCVPKIDAKRARKARKIVVFEVYGTDAHFYTPY